MCAYDQPTHNHSIHPMNIKKDINLPPDQLRPPSHLQLAQLRRQMLKDARIITIYEDKREEI